MARRCGTPAPAAVMMSGPGEACGESTRATAIAGRFRPRTFAASLSIPPRGLLAKAIACAGAGGFDEVFSKAIACKGTVGVDAFSNAIVRGEARGVDEGKESVEVTFAAESASKRGGTIRRTVSTALGCKFCRIRCWGVISGECCSLRRDTALLCSGDSAFEKD